MWVRYFLDLGIQWPDDGIQRIGIVSSPCDSAAAGLIALGALIRRLGEREANDLGSHKRRINSLQPGHKGVLRRNGDRGRYVVHRRDPDGTLWLEHTTQQTRFRFLEYHAGDWYFDGEAPVEVRSGDELPWLPIYKALAPGFALDESNLRFSDSSIVLAGRSTGRTVAAAVLASLRFSIDDAGASLLDLLTLHEPHSARAVSRIRYLNARAAAGREFDREGEPPRTVIADGGDALLRTLALECCEDASIIAHLPRTDDQSRLEEVGESLAAMRQWYEIDTLTPGRLPAPPRGVVLAMLQSRRRA